MSTTALMWGCVDVNQGGDTWPFGLPNDLHWRYFGAPALRGVDMHDRISSFSLEAGVRPAEAYLFEHDDDHFHGRVVATRATGGTSLVQDIGAAMNDRVSGILLWGPFSGTELDRRDAGASIRGALRSSVDAVVPHTTSPTSSTFPPAREFPISEGRVGITVYGPAIHWHGYDTTVRRGFPTWESYARVELAYETRTYRYASGPYEANPLIDRSSVNVTIWIDPTFAVAWTEIGSGHGWLRDKARDFVDALLVPLAPALQQAGARLHPVPGVGPALQYFLPVVAYNDLGVLAQGHTADGVIHVVVSG